MCGKQTNRQLEIKKQHSTEESNEKKSKSQPTEITIESKPYHGKNEIKYIQINNKIMQVCYVYVLHVVAVGKRKFVKKLKTKATTVWKKREILYSMPLPAKCQIQQ